MGREEALELLHQGKKVTHEYFDDDEFIYISERTGTFTTEDGYDFTEQWWEYDKFKDGWSEYKIK